MRFQIGNGCFRLSVSVAAILGVLSFAVQAQEQEQEQMPASGGWVRSTDVETVQESQRETPPRSRAPDTESEAPKRDMESAIYETWKDVLPKVKNEVKPDEGADHTLPEPEETGDVTYVPPIGKDPENATAVMNSSNPMVDGQCRAEVENLHVKSYARLHEVSEDVALEEIRAHYEELRTRMSQAERVTPGMVLHHIAECDEFCLPRQVFLTSCHVFAVSQADRREIVFFDYDESFVRPEFWEPVRGIAEAVLAEPAGARRLQCRALAPADCACDRHAQGARRPGGPDHLSHHRRVYAQSRSHPAGEIRDDTGG